MYFILFFVWLFLWHSLSSRFWFFIIRFCSYLFSCWRLFVESSNDEKKKTDWTMNMNTTATHRLTIENDDNAKSDEIKKWFVCLTDLLPLATKVNGRKSMWIYRNIARAYQRHKLKWEWCHLVHIEWIDHLFVREIQKRFSTIVTKSRRDRLYSWMDVGCEACKTPVVVIVELWRSCLKNRKRNKIYKNKLKKKKEKEIGSMFKWNMPVEILNNYR